MLLNIYSYLIRVYEYIYIYILWTIGFVLYGYIYYMSVCQIFILNMLFRPMVQLVQGVSKKTWTFFDIGIIPLFIMNTFQNFVWL